MSLRLGINGLGRIGRSLLRIVHERAGIEVVAANDLAAPEQLAALLTHETFRRALPDPVVAEPGALRIGEASVRLDRCEAPGEIPWSESGVEVVVEASGVFTDRRQAAAHLGGSVGTVVVSANGSEMDLTVCLGVNESLYDPLRHRVVSNASCTTNCLAVVVDVLHREFGLRRGLLNTVHCYNNNQSLVDAPHKDPRRARAAAVNMIPTTTGAITGLGRVMPELKGRIDGFAVRVPTPNVSLIDLVAELERGPDLVTLQEAFRAAAAERLSGLLAVSDEPLVSSDLSTDPHSAIVDLPLLQSVDKRLFRIVAWYDNEWGYANRLADLVELIGRSQSPGQENRS